jgi:murein L,D-transpeptidase YafK
MNRVLTITLITAMAGVLIWANLPQKRLPLGMKADKVVVDKANRLLVLYQGARILKTYQVALGRNPVGHKQQEGDKRTPEGFYKIDFRNERSAFYRSLHVSYPERRDIEIAEGKRVSPGGDIMVHGIRNGLGWLGKLHRFVDWTAGCIAVTNTEIEEIWQVVPDGTPIEIHA